MTDVVLDASVVLAHLRGEPGGSLVEEVGYGGMLSAVNLCEVVKQLVDLGYPDESIQAAMAVLPCEVAAFDQAQALRAGILRRLTRSAGLSLGDRACLSLAEREGVSAATADRVWAGLDVGVEVVLIR